VTARRQGHPLRSTVIDLVAPVAVWAMAIFADAVTRVVMALALPVGLVPALGGAPVAGDVPRAASGD
jgi:hypothetical protein